MRRLLAPCCLAAAVLATPAATPGSPPANPLWKGDGPLLLIRSVDTRFTDQGRYLLAVDDESLTVWDIATGRPTATFTTPGGPIGFAERPVYVSLATWRTNGGRTVTLSGLDGQNKRTLEYSAAVQQVLFPRDGYTMAVATADGWVIYGVVGSDETISFVAESVYDPGSYLLALGRKNGTVALWDTNTRKVVSVLRGDPASLRSLGDHVVGRQGKTFKLWDLATGKELADLGEGTQARFVASGKSIMVQRPAGLRLYDSATGKGMAEMEGSGVLSDNGDTFVRLGAGDFVEILNVGSGKVRSRIALTPAASQWRALSLTPDGRTLIVNTQPGAGKLASAEVFDLDSGRLLLRARDANVIMAPDGRRLATVGNGTAQTWVVARLRGWPGQSFPTCL